MLMSTLCVCGECLFFSFTHQTGQLTRKSICALLKIQLINRHSMMDLVALIKLFEDGSTILNPFHIILALDLEDHDETNAEFQHFQKRP